MYFASRMQAGRMLAAQLVGRYRYENCAVVALDDGGVMIGAQIASQLHCVLMMILNSEIMLPREPEAIAGITFGGNMAYNQKYSPGEIDELVGEYRGIIEQEKLSSLHELNRIIGTGGVINQDFLKGHNIILVSEGLKSGFLLDMMNEYLKPIAIDHLVIATPIASIQAVDRMHIIADDIYCLNVVEEYINTDHYYDQHDVPDHNMAIKLIEEIVLKWQ